MFHFTQHISLCSLYPTPFRLFPFTQSVCSPLPNPSVPLYPTPSLVFPITQNPPLPPQPETITHFGVSRASPEGFEGLGPPALPSGGASVSRVNPLVRMQAEEDRRSYNAAQVSQQGVSG